MQVAKWGNSLAVRLPAKLVAKLELRPGDQVELRVAGKRKLAVARDESERRARLRALAELRRMGAAWPLPKGYVFNREELHEREPERSKAFFDTSVLVYTGEPEDPRAAMATALIATGALWSVQVLNEFVAVLRRERKMPWPEVRHSLAALRTLCPLPVPLTLAMHEMALALSARYGYFIHDAMILAAAMESGCVTVYSEDMQHGQTIGPLTIRNPFR